MFGRRRRIEFAHGAIAGKAFAEALHIPPEQVALLKIIADPRAVLMVEVTIVPTTQQVSQLVRLASEMKNVVTKQDRETRALEIVRQVLDAKDPEELMHTSIPTPIHARRARKSDA